MTLTSYGKQWLVFDKAERLGWNGRRPGVLGTHTSEKALESAKQFIAEKALEKIAAEPRQNLDEPRYL